MSDSPRDGFRRQTPDGLYEIATAGITPELLTSRQAAQLCGCGERSLWRWSRSGRAPAPIYIGDGPRPAVRYRRSDLLQWIAAGCPRWDATDGIRQAVGGIIERTCGPTLRMLEDGRAQG